MPKVKGGYINKLYWLSMWPADRPLCPVINWLVSHSIPLHHPPCTKCTIYEVDSAWVLVSFLKYLLMRLLMRILYSLTCSPARKPRARSNNGRSQREREKERECILEWILLYCHHEFVSPSVHRLPQMEEEVAWCLETTTALIEMKEKGLILSHYHLSCGRVHQGDHLNHARSLLKLHLHPEWIANCA